MAFPAFAQIQDVQITVVKKKLDEAKKGNGPVTITAKEVAYTVTVQNRRFAEMAEVQVKYMIFLADEQGGSREKAVTVSHNGSETIKNLASNATVSFETKPFILAKEELAGNYYYASGASSRAQDKVSGVWIRAFANGKQIGEYANPPSVTKKYDWKE